VGNPLLALEERTRDLLVNAGLQEVVTYSLTVPEREAPLGAGGDYVRLKNPIHSERAVMRHSLLASVLEATATNLKNTENVRLFEIGYVYLPRQDQPLPDEKLRLCLVMTGRRLPESWADSQAPRQPLDFFDLKGVVEALAQGLHLEGVSYRRAAVEFLHPGRSAELLLGGQSVGVLGQLHPRTAQTYAKDWEAVRLGQQDVLVADLDLEAILKAVPPRHLSRPLSSFPPALRDIAVVVNEDVTAEQVEAEIRTAGGELLQDVRLFDLYRGESIGAGKRSLAYALTYQAFDRTLADKEIEKAHEKVQNRLKHTLKASIRGQD
jgi:phenylalanyl-tRNA synthetase beta chain